MHKDGKCIDIPSRLCYDNHDGAVYGPPLFSLNSADQFSQHAPVVAFEFEVAGALPRGKRTQGADRRQHQVR